MKYLGVATCPRKANRRFATASITSAEKQVEGILDKSFLCSAPSTGSSVARSVCQRGKLLQRGERILNPWAPLGPVPTCFSIAEDAFAH
jgi:hypothetical protein